MVVYWVKPPPAMYASHIGAGLSPRYSIFIPDLYQDAWKGVEDGLKCSGSCTHVGGLEKDPGSWFQT